MTVGSAGSLATISTVRSRVTDFRRYAHALPETGSGGGRSTAYFPTGARSERCVAVTMGMSWYGPPPQTFRTCLGRSRAICPRELKLHAPPPFVTLMRYTPFSGISVDSMRPPITSRAGPFMVVAVTMAVATGGLLWWKLAPEPAAPASPAASAPTALQVLDRALPPPPPPPALPSSATETASAKSPQSARTAGAAASGCAGHCTGSATAELQSALRAKAGLARSCYERALRQNAMLEGRMTVAVRVGPQGRICGANVVSNGLGDPAVAHCVAGILRSGSLPAPSGGCVDVQVPMSFVGRQ
jgi:hypothetical protein